MAYLIPPMEDETPPEFIAFVAARRDMLLDEAARLIGGDRSAPELCMQVLTDLAGRWRWLTWISRLTHRDAAAQHLDRRLTARTKQWREDQIYPVEVSVLRENAVPERALEPVGAPATTALYERPPTPPEESLAQQLAYFLPSTIRAGSEVVADAEIAWVHAYRRYLWHRYLRMGGGMVLLVGGMVQFMSQFSATT
ncbi:hypothetical protein ACQP2Y_34275 [Actinoplanes sp. CA-051413]|uniref:hypothetical protein n=1 Tax=Actinoplanes sp. CA-051413 TaxID=3239899 RepID=UPI003D99BCB5